MGHKKLKNKTSVRNNAISGKFEERFGLFASAAIVDELQGAQIPSTRQAATATSPAVDSGGVSSTIVQ
jgi:hypothetical protein